MFKNYLELIFAIVLLIGGLNFQIYEILNGSIIDKQLNKIRTEGRQVFLETSPTNFSRIFHDYSDERKGFVLWRDALEERLT